MKTQLDRSAVRIDTDRPQAPPPGAEKTGAKSSGALRTSFGEFSSRPQPSAGEASSSAPPRKTLGQLLAESPPNTPSAPPAISASRPAPLHVPKGPTLQQLLAQDPPTPPAMRRLESFKGEGGELTPEAIKLLKSALPHGGSAIQKLREREVRKHPTSLSHHLKSALHGEPKELKGERFAKFMAMAQSDIEAVAKRAKLSLRDAAELMRLGLSQAALDKKLTDADKGRMLYALYGIREKQAAQESLGNALAHHPKFKGLPVGEAWRMALDHKVWGDGKHQGLRFENEPGYMGGMFRGLTALIQSELDGRPLNAKLLRELHDQCTTGVFTMRAMNELPLRPEHVTELAALTALPAERQDSSAPDAAYTLFAQNYRDGNMVDFGMTAGENLSEAGYREMMQNHDPARAGFYLHARMPGDDGFGPLPRDTEYSAQRRIKLVAIPDWRRQIVARAESIIQSHARQIESAASADDKLRVIARCCQALERAHLFSDGNARTVGFLTLNKLLLQNGMAPAMFEDPNHFDGFSSDELVEEIKRGQATFARYAGQPDEVQQPAAQQRATTPQDSGATSQATEAASRPGPSRHAGEDEGEIVPANERRVRFAELSEVFGQEERVPTHRHDGVPGAYQSSDAGSLSADETAANYAQELRVARAGAHLDKLASKDARIADRVANGDIPQRVLRKAKDLTEADHGDIVISFQERQAQRNDKLLQNAARQLMKLVPDSAESAQEFLQQLMQNPPAKPAGGLFKKPKLTPEQELYAAMKAVPEQLRDDVIDSYEEMFQEQAKRAAAAQLHAELERMNQEEEDAARQLGIQ